MTSSLFANLSAISKQKWKKLDEAAGQRLAATGIGVAFAASLGTLVCPASGALAAQTVQVDVVNPASNPALTSSVDDPARTSYEASLGCSPTQQNFVCEYNFPLVPAGFRLVVQHISGNLLFRGTPLFVEAILAGNETGGSSAFFAPFVVSDSIFDQSVLQYFEAGSHPDVVIFAAGNVPFDLTGKANPVTLSGYLLKCDAAATPCAPIAP